MLDWIAPVFQGNWATPVVILHVGSAVSAILIGLVPMFARKGGQLHNRAGLGYFWLMMTTCASGGILLIKYFNFFLTIITLLSFYTAFTGYRVMFRRHKSAGWLDWAASGINLMGGIAFVIWGGLTLFGMIEGLPVVFAVIGILFGIFLANDAVKDMRAYLNPPTGKRWWFIFHMDRMLGSYIALITAFAVQAIGPRLPADIFWITWIAPGIIGSIVTWRWTAHYRRLFDPPSKQTEYA